MALAHLVDAEVPADGVKRLVVGANDAAPTGDDKTFMRTDREFNEL